MAVALYLSFGIFLYGSKIASSAYHFANFQIRKPEAYTIIIPSFQLRIYMVLSRFKRMDEPLNSLLNKFNNIGTDGDCSFEIKRRKTADIMLNDYSRQCT